MNTAGLTYEQFKWWLSEYPENFYLNYTRAGSIYMISLASSWSKYMTHDEDNLEGLILDIDEVLAPHGVKFSHVMSERELRDKITIGLTHPYVRQPGL